MRVTLGYVDIIEGVVSLSDDGQSFVTQTTRRKNERGFADDVRGLYAYYSAEAHRRLTATEFLTLLPLRLRGLNWARIEKPPRQRRSIPPLFSDPRAKAKVASN